MNLSHSCSFHSRHPSGSKTRPEKSSSTLKGASASQRFSGRFDSLRAFAFFSSLVSFRSFFAFVSVSFFSNSSFGQLSFLTLLLQFLFLYSSIFLQFLRCSFQFLF